MSLGDDRPADDLWDASDVREAALWVLEWYEENRTSSDVSNSVLRIECAKAIAKYAEYRTRRGDVERLFGIHHEETWTR